MLLPMMIHLPGIHWPHPSLPNLLLVPTALVSFLVRPRVNQIVNAIHQCKGGDEFAKEKNGLHFGVRKLCVPFWENNPPNPGEKPAGVMVLDHNADSAEDAFSRSNLKYPTPDVSTFLPHEYLSHYQFEVLLRYMDETNVLYPLYENGYFTLCCQEEEQERIEQEN